MSYTPYPEGIRPLEKPRIALMHITVKEKEMWTPDTKWSLYESLSTAKLYRDWGYDVEVLASEPIPGTTLFDAVSGSDFDLTVVQSAGPAFVGDKKDRIHHANEQQYLYLASVPENQTIAVLGNEMALPFLDLQQIPRLDKMYQEDHWVIKAKTKFFSQTEDLAHSAKNLDRREPASLRREIEHVPLWSHTMNWLKGVDIPYTGKQFLVAYPGRARTFTDRGANLARLLPISGEILWTGTSKEKAENWLGRDLSHVTFRPGTTNKPGAILAESYNQAVATFIPYEPACEQCITPRMVEACISSAIVFIDDEWPATSAMLRYLPFLNDRRVVDGHDLISSIPQSIDLQNEMLAEQFEAVKILWPAVEGYRRAIEELLVENILA